jgi:hypothetical protein
MVLSFGGDSSRFLFSIHRNRRSRDRTIERLGSGDDGVRFAFVGEVLARAELSVSGLSQDGQFLDQFLGRVVTVGLAFAFDIGLAALQTAIDQQADVLAGVLGTIPVALTGLFVLIVGVQDGLLELLALLVARRRRDLGNFLQAREFALDISIADDILGGVQDGLGLGLLLGIGGIVASGDAGLDGIDFRAISVPFLRVQGGDDGLIAGVTFGQLFTEFASLGQHLSEPFAIFVLHDTTTRATIADVGHIGHIGHGQGRTGQSQQSQDHLHDDFEFLERLEQNISTELDSKKA